MCDSCRDDHSRRFGSSQIVVIALILTLIGLAAVGATARLTEGPDADRACREAAAAAIAFQAAVTRDRLDHSRLHAHTRAFSDKLAELEAARCPDTVRFVQGTRIALAGLCSDCEIALANARRDYA